MYAKHLLLGFENLFLILFWFSFSLGAEPFLAPNDPFLRHEIRLLGDEGGLNSLQNTWTLGRSGFSDFKFGRFACK
jgi:hypothetical protein